jgi:hypothetical protein
MMDPNTVDPLAKECWEIKKKGEDIRRKKGKKKAARSVVDGGNGDGSNGEASS